MKQYHPNEVLNYFSERSSEEESGVFVTFDISGFTKLSSELALKSPYSPEDISNFLAHFFYISIKLIKENNGFVLQFSGDGYSAFIPETNYSKIFIKQIKLFKKEFKAICLVQNDNFHNLHLKTSINYGTLKLEELQYKEAKFVTFHSNALSQNIKDNNKSKDSEVFIRNKEFLPNNTSIVKRDVKVTLLDDLDFKWSEYRSVICVFIQFNPTVSKNDIEFVIETIQNYKGYCNKVISSDEGTQILAIFGAPQVKENFIDESFFAVQKLRVLKDKIKVSVGAGTALCGIVGTKEYKEYTVLGKFVNTAAHNLSNHDYGEFICDNTAFLLQNTKLSTTKINEDYHIIHRMFDTGISLKKELPFFGRDRDYEKLSQIIENENEQRNLVYLKGSAGIGKTRLLNELKDNCPQKVMWIACEESDTTPFQPIYRFLNSFFLQSKQANITENFKAFNIVFTKLLRKIDSRSLTAILNNIKPNIKSVILLPDNLQNNKILSLHKTTTLLVIKIFIRCLFYRKSVLVVDDLQFADEDTLILIRELLLDESDYIGTIVLAMRDSFNPSFCFSESNTLKSHNFSISKIDSLELSKYLRNATEIPQNLHKQIVEKSEGNPFFFNQLLLFYIENREISTASIPITIKAVLLARIDRLSEQMKEVIRYASIIGTKFSIEVLTEMCRNKNISPLIESGKENDIWYPFKEFFYIFKHSILRDTIYGMQLKKNLEQIHKICAETYIKMYKNDFNQYKTIAYHFECSGYSQKSRFYLRKAAAYYKAKDFNYEAVSILRKVKNSIQTPNLEYFKTCFLLINALIATSKLKEAEELVRNLIEFPTITKTKNLKFMFWSCLIKLRASNETKHLSTYIRRYELYAKGSLINDKFETLYHQVCIEIYYILGYYQKTLEHQEILESIFARRKNSLPKSIFILELQKSRTLFELNEIPKAIEILEKNVINVSEYFGKVSVPTIDNKYRLAKFYLMVRNFDLANKLIQECLEAANTILPKKDKQFQNIKKAYIDLLILQRNFFLANEILKEQIDLKKDVFPKESFEILELQKLMIINFFLMGRMDLAHPLSLEVMSNIEKYHCFDDRNVWDYYNLHAGILKSIGKIDQASEIYLRIYYKSYNFYGMQHINSIKALLNYIKIDAYYYSFERMESFADQVEELLFNDKIKMFSLSEFEPLLVFYVYLRNYSKAEQIALRMITKNIINPIQNNVVFSLTLLIWKNTSLETYAKFIEKSKISDLDSHISYESLKNIYSNSAKYFDLAFYNFLMFKINNDVNYLAEIESFKESIVHPAEYMLKQFFRQNY